MHSRPLFLVAFAGCFLPGILSMPLETTRSTDEANRQTSNMERVLHDPDNPNHDRRRKVAFGIHPELDRTAFDYLMKRGAPYNLVRRQSRTPPKVSVKNKLPAQKTTGAKATAAGGMKTTPKLTTPAKALGGAKKSALTPGAKKSVLTAGAKNPKLATTAKPLGQPTAGRKSALTPGAKKPVLTAKKPSSKPPATPKITKLTPGTKGKLPAAKGVAGARTPSLKIAGAYKPMSKSPTVKRVASAKLGATSAKKVGTDKKLSTPKSFTKGSSRAGTKNVASARTAGSKAPTRGADIAGSKKVPGAHTPKSVTKGPQPASKSLTKGASRAGPRKVASAPKDAHVKKATTNLGRTRSSPGAGEGFSFSSTGGVHGTTTVTVSKPDPHTGSTNNDHKPFALFQGVNGPAAGNGQSSNSASGIPANTYRLGSGTPAGPQLDVAQVAISHAGPLEDSVWFAARPKATGR